LNAWAIGDGKSSLTREIDRVKKISFKLVKPFKFYMIESIKPNNSYFRVKLSIVFALMTDLLSKTDSSVLHKYP